MLNPNVARESVKSSMFLSSVYFLLRIINKKMPDVCRHFIDYSDSSVPSVSSGDGEGNGSESVLSIPL